MGESETHEISGLRFFVRWLLLGMGLAFFGTIAYSSGAHLYAGAKPELYDFAVFLVFVVAFGITLGLVALAVRSVARK